MDTSKLSAPVARKAEAIVAKIDAALALPLPAYVSTSRMRQLRGYVVGAAAVSDSFLNWELGMYRDAIETEASFLRGCSERMYGRAA